MSSKKVTKNDLLEAVYQNTKYEKLAVQTIMENLFDQMKEVLKDGNTIELRGFGTFEARLRKGRQMPAIQKQDSSFLLLLIMLSLSVLVRN